MSPDQRRRLMARFRGKDTKPEILVRRALHAAGRRFRLHRGDLPGKPDIALPRDRTVVFVHGCFWHGHRDCSIARLPKTQPLFWAQKFEQNQARDERVRAALTALGWRVIVIWECEAKSDHLSELLVQHGLINRSR
ncbi:very short patch repair endonuclease [Sphingomonas changbaiensis]|uniref:very short patch repair endonuclease n=1 Tax=Sphingomonas changbaiensis TaxID=529705 RepID=UPI002480E7AF|nr:very short patch repair endonuclease [Sphingomonas changbaiensis]